jgi:hypothetical protein
LLIGSSVFSGCPGQETKVAEGVESEPHEVVERLLVALSRDDCGSIYDALPPRLVPPREDFVAGCASRKKSDARTERMPEDLASWDFEVTTLWREDDRASVSITPSGLGPPRSSDWPLVRQDGAWGALDLFDDSRDIERPGQWTFPPPQGELPPGWHKGMVSLPAGEATLGLAERGPEVRAPLPGGRWVEALWVGRHEVTGEEEWTLATNAQEAPFRGGAFDTPLDAANARSRIRVGLPFRLDALGFRCVREAG